VNRRRIPQLAFGLLITTAACAAQPQSVVGAPGEVDAATMADIGSVASSLGSGGLDPASTPPTTATAVLTDRQEALTLTYGTAEGDPGDPDAQVYVVQLEGSFRGYMAKGPTQESVDSIKGNALVFVYDVASREVVAWGIPPEPHDLSKLGRVFTVPVKVSPTHGVTSTPAPSSSPDEAA